MNKQKQIEEMARTVCGLTNHCNKCFCGDSDEYCGFKMVAQRILDAGYRKIPELPKETVLTADDIAELLTIVARDTRKKTARKFKKLLKALVADRNCNEDYDWEDVQVDGQIFVECVDEICKEFTEGKV